MNTHKILKSGGYFRLVLPDLEYSINNYTNGSSADCASGFLKETSLGKKERNRGLKGFVKEWLGNSQHLWMWDHKSIAQELEHAGFIGIRKAEYGDAADTSFIDVEDKGRWENSLSVECKKV
jgi:predicted SAM-dependent methyltransferase